MFRSNVKISDDNLDRQIRHDPNPIFVLLPGAFSPDAHMLETLRRHYPNITYIHDVGPEPSTSLPAGVEPVLPAVDLTEEEEQFSEMSDAQHFVEKLDAS